jgi:hypothetical protein
LIDELVGRAVQFVQLLLAVGAALHMIGKGVESRRIAASESELAEFDRIRARRFHGCPRSRARVMARVH